jgi:hypothetical protein
MEPRTRLPDAARVTRTTIAMIASAIAHALYASGAAAQTAPAPARPCAAPEHRQFDFWIGRWDVYLPDGSRAGENVIESVSGGCALLESWSGRGGFSGKSLNHFDRAGGKWHQVWIDSSGSRLDLLGGLAESAMVMYSRPDGAGDKGVLQRISWTPASDGTVRQLWERSDDGGLYWKTLFDGRYVRAK